MGLEPTSSFILLNYTLVKKGLPELMSFQKNKNQHHIHRCVID